MSATSGAAAPDIAKPQAMSFLQSLVNHPIGFWFIFWGEFAERCSFYGMRAILATYLVDRLDFTKEDSGSAVSVWLAACYFCPLVGGFVADNFLGKYNTIIFFSLPYILGQLIIGTENELFVFIALVLLAMGSGVIKPNISTLMGLTYDQFRPGQEQLRSNAFSMFYMSINIGAAISQTMVPLIRTYFKESPHAYFYAFMFPAFLMVLAFIAFAIGKPFYAKEVISQAKRTPEERALQWQIVGQIGGLFFLVMFFWAVFDQASSTWIFFAQTYMDCTVFGWKMDPEQVQALNPILIVALLPFITILWTVLDAKGFHVRPTSKMILGFLLTAACMGTMAICGYATGQAEKRDLVKDGVVVMNDQGQPKQDDFCPEEKKVNVGWQMVAYLLITIAEILISVTGLELAFVAAPKSMKSFVTSLWLLSVGLANLFLNVPLSRFYPSMHPGNYFAMLTVTLLVVTVLFYFIARRFNRLRASRRPRKRRPPWSQSTQEIILRQTQNCRATASWIVLAARGSSRKTSRMTVSPADIKRSCWHRSSAPPGRRRIAHRCPCRRP